MTDSRLVLLSGVLTGAVAAIAIMAFGFSNRPKMAPPFEVRDVDSPDLVRRTKVARRSDEVALEERIGEGDVLNSQEELGQNDERKAVLERAAERMRRAAGLTRGTAGNMLLHRYATAFVVPGSMPKLKDGIPRTEVSEGVLALIVNVKNAHERIGNPPWENSRFMVCSALVSPRHTVRGRDFYIPASIDTSVDWHSDRLEWQEDEAVSKQNKLRELLEEFDRYRVSAENELLDAMIAHASRTRPVPNVYGYFLTGQSLRIKYGAELEKNVVDGRKIAREFYENERK